MLDAFERRRKPALSRFWGPISVDMWGPGYDNWVRLISAGFDVSVFLNDREMFDASAADPDKGTVRTMVGELRGTVEIRLTRP